MAKIKKLDGKDDRSDKESYRPISILPNKIVYERLVWPAISVIWLDFFLNK